MKMHSSLVIASNHTPQKYVETPQKPHKNTKFYLLLKLIKLKKHTIIIMVK